MRILPARPVALRHNLFPPVKSWFLGLLVLLFASSLPGQTEDLEAGVSLHMEAPLDGEGGQQFLLRIETNDPYECGDAYLPNEVTIRKNKVGIRVLGVTIPEDCSGEMGPASSRIDLSGLTPGLYAIRAVVNMQVLKATLEVMEGHYRLSCDEDPDLMSVGNGRLNLIPRGAFWGRCRYQDPAAKAHAEEFMRELEGLGAEPVPLKAGDYGEFYAHFEGKPRESSLGVDDYAYPFIYRYKGDVADLERIAAKYSDKIGISMGDLQGWAWPNRD